MDGFSRCKTLLQAGCFSCLVEDMLNLRPEMLAIDELPAWLAFLDNTPNLPSWLAETARLYAWTRIALSGHGDHRERHLPFFSALTQSLQLEIAPEPLKTLQAVQGKLVLAQGGRGRVVLYAVCVVGDEEKANLTPASIASRMDAQAVEAMACAFDKARRFEGSSASLLFLPILDARSREKLQGNSLGLPLALSALAALSGTPMPSRLAASGILAPNRSGRSGELLLPVGHLPAKSLAARAAGCSLLLIPKGGEGGLVAPDGLTIQEVDNLDHAWSWARVYGPHGEHVARIMDLVRSRPLSLLDNLDALDVRLVKDLFTADFRQRLRTALLDMMDVKLFQRLCAILDAGMRLHGSEQGKAELLASLFDAPDDVTALGRDFPLQTFHWCSLQLALANHHGHSEKAAHWKNLANTFKDKARTADPASYTRHVNLMYIAERHNRYLFITELPSEFQDILEEEEDLQRRRPHANYVLGALYGTMAQNYAFCGPDHLDRTMHFVAMAKQAFDPGVQPADCLRQDSYAAFALLDAGLLVEAGETTLRLFQATTWAEIQVQPKNMNPFLLFLLSRFLADTHEQWANLDKGGNLPRLARELLNTFHPQDAENGHPHQLILYNCGRLALFFEDKDATAWLERSSEISVNSEETIQPMALLPLAVLYHTSAKLEGILDRASSILKKIRQSRYIDQSHFEALTNLETGNALEVLWMNPGRFFPFTYR